MTKQSENGMFFFSTMEINLKKKYITTRSNGKKKFTFENSILVEEILSIA